MTGEKKQGRKLLPIVIYAIGLLACTYPAVSSEIMQRYQNRSVATYDSAISASSDSELSEALADATSYNLALYQSETITVGNFDTGALNAENYDRLLNLAGNGIMGSIEIPKIDVNLPIYHGTSDEVLDIGIGHLQQSSLPVGGENTRAVLTGHRGLPNAKLFTRLDELESGDLFFIYTLNQKKAYQVCDIEVMKPEDVDKLKIQEGEDLVTLLTCHPYGINSHRLIVTGSRVDYKEEIYQSIENGRMSTREFSFQILPLLFLGLGIVTFTRNSNRKKKVKKYGT